VSRPASTPPEILLEPENRVPINKIKSIKKEFIEETEIFCAQVSQMSKSTISCLLQVVLMREE